MSRRSRHERRRHLEVRRELQRKLLHILLFAVPLLGLLLEGWPGRLGLILATLLVVVTDALRLRNPRFGAFVARYFGRLFRKDEHARLLGATYYAVASCVCVLLFADAIAVSAISFLVIGDTVAAIVGKRFGRPRYWGKSIEGSVACFAVCFLVGMLLLDEWWVAGGGALMATVAEAVPLPVNDNFRIPLLSGLAMHFLTFHI